MSEHMNEVERLLALHEWHVTRWSGGDWGWRCSCPVVDAGTEITNPDRYVRHPDRTSASKAAVEHVVDELDRLAEQGTAVPCDPEGIPVVPEESP